MKTETDSGLNPYISTDEKEIDLLDLAAYLLRRIMWILLAGCLCGGIVGGYRYYKTKALSQNMSVIEEAKIIKETEYKIDWDELEQYNLDLNMYNQAIKDYQEQSELIEASDQSTLYLIKKQRDYLQNALYMKLNPYHVWRAMAIVKISGTSLDYPAYQIEEMYKQDLNNESYLMDLAKKWKTKEAYLKELVAAYSIGSPTDTGSNISEVILQEVEDENEITTKIFCIRSYGNTEDEAQALMDLALEELQKIHKEYLRKYPHQIEVLSKECSSTVDTGIQSGQKDRVIYTQTLLQQMKDNRDKGALLVEPEKVQLIKSEETESEITENEEPAPVISPKRETIKYGAIGFVAGIFLMCLWFTIKYMLNDKLVDYKDIERVGLRLKDLGSLSDQGVAMTAANIRNFCPDKKRLFLTGTSEENAFRKACETLKEYLMEYELVCARDLIRDPQTREKLRDCDAVVLIEQKGVSQYSEMTQEVTFLANARKRIVGIITI